MADCRGCKSYHKVLPTPTKSVKNPTSFKEVLSCSMETLAPTNISKPAIQQQNLQEFLASYQRHNTYHPFHVSFTNIAAACANSAHSHTANYRGCKSHPKTFPPLPKSVKNLTSFKEAMNCLPRKFQNISYQKMGHNTTNIRIVFPDFFLREQLYPP